MTSTFSHTDSLAIAPIIRPVQLMPSALLELHAAHPARYPALLESAAAGTALGRFDILFAYPQESLTLRTNGALDGRSEATFLSALDAWWRELRTPQIDVSLPFHGGWLVYLGYELAAQIEPRLRLPATASGLVARATRIPAAIVYEHGSGNAWIVTEKTFETLANSIESDLRTLSPAAQSNATLLEATVVEDAAEQYIDGVRRTLDYISRGDVYQVNLSRAWRGRFVAGTEPHHVYRELRKTNPGPFCALAVWPELAIVSSSPERLVSVRDRQISTRPIAGTRPRGNDQTADALLVEELQAHPKERAEHIMLIDLERNDLGRVCDAGTVEVDEYMSIESYAHVHHIVSNVRGRLRSDVGPGEALAAVFPGGTITGCPKVRCMEIIAELEDTARGVYTGSLGYLNRDGSMDFSILIRSIEIQNGEFSLRAGAGIVADSIPERELAESRAKARGVLRALNVDAH